MLDRLFGPRLLSIQFVVTSSVLSLVSVHLFTILKNELTHEVWVSQLFEVGWALALAFIAQSVVQEPNRLWFIVAGIACVADMIVREVFLYHPHWFVAVYMSLGLLIGLTLDMLSVFAIRAILGMSAASNRRRVLMLAVVADALLACVLLMPSVFYVSRGSWVWLNQEWISHLGPSALRYGSFILAWAIAIGSATNLFAGFSALLLLMVITATLITRLVWPFLARLIYVLYWRRLIENSKLLFTLGLVLLLHAWPSLSWLKRVTP